MVQQDLRRAMCTLCLLATTILVGLISARGAQGQTGDDVNWSEPVMLSGPRAVLQQTALSTDPWGGIHVFWTQNEAEDVTSADPTNMIYYTHSDGETWSRPYDLFAGPDWVSYQFPFATHDAAGRLFLTWAGFDGLHYSSAPASEAYDAKKWQGPYLLVEGRQIGHSGLAVDSLGVLHLVYSAFEAGTNVMYLSSTDRGETWTEPVAVSEIFAAYPQAADRPRIAIDSQDGLHVVWAENYPPAWVGRQVLYSRSLDGGRTWEVPEALSSLSTDPEWNANISVAVDNHDRIHVIWVCGKVHRCYRRSEDRGRTWSDGQPIFGNLLGSSGWDAMVGDTSGQVYWLGSLREPQGVYFSQLTEGGWWREPPLLLVSAAEGGQLGEGHFPHLAISQGNRLSAIMVAGDKGPVWYLEGRTHSPALPPVAAPTETPRPARTPVAATIEAIETPPTPKPTVVAPAEPPPTTPNATSGFPPLAWAVVPVVLLLAIVLAFSVYRARNS